MEKVELLEQLRVRIRTLTRTELLEALVENNQVIFSAQTRRKRIEFPSKILHCGLLDHYSISFITLHLQSLFPPNLLVLAAMSATAFWSGPPMCRSIPILSKTRNGYFWNKTPIVAGVEPSNSSPSLIMESSTWRDSSQAHVSSLPPPLPTSREASYPCH